jgi:Zn-dependent protease with chaperone function
MTDRATPRPQHVETLWARVEANRRKLALFFLGFIATYAVGGAVVVYIIGFALMALGVMRGVFMTTAAWSAAHSGLVTATMGAAVIGALIAAIQVALSLLEPEKKLLSRLGASLSPTGTYLTTKDALKDMALAAGFSHAPPLWVIPDCSRVNAFAVGRDHSRTIVGVTQGFADRLDHDQQRAVLANIMARVARGNVLWATGVSALAGPLWALREADLRRGCDETMGDVFAGTTSRFDQQEARGLIGGSLFYVPIILLTEMLLAGHQRSARLSAEKADAEGMLLLRDPTEMLDALRTVLESNHTVPSAGEAYSMLFYAWAGFGFAPEDDPEMSRIARLREVLGAEGMAEVPAVSSAPSGGGPA